MIFVGKVKNYWDSGNKRKTDLPGREFIDLSSSYINFLDHDVQSIPVSLTQMSLIKSIMPLPFLGSLQLVPGKCHYTGHIYVIGTPNSSEISEHIGVIADMSDKAI
jgi:hypothetical protein